MLVSCTHLFELLFIALIFSLRTTVRIMSFQHDGVLTFLIETVIWDFALRLKEEEK